MTFVKCSVSIIISTHPSKDTKHLIALGEFFPDKPFISVRNADSRTLKCSSLHPHFAKLLEPKRKKNRKSLNVLIFSKQDFSFLS